MNEDLVVVELREDDLGNSLAKISTLAMDGNRDAIEKLAMIRMVAPNALPDWIDPDELLIEYNFEGSDHYLYALISKYQLAQAFTVAETRYNSNGDFDAGKHLALFLSHDPLFLLDQDSTHFANMGIEKNTVRAQNILIEMCAKEHNSACNLLSELFLQPDV